jgi:hypothetical protein
LLMTEQRLAWELDGVSSDGDEREDDSGECRERGTEKSRQKKLVEAGNDENHG